METSSPHKSLPQVNCASVEGLPCSSIPPATASSSSSSLLSTGHLENHALAGGALNDDIEATQIEFFTVPSLAAIINRCHSHDDQKPSASYEKVSCPKSSERTNNLDISGQHRSKWLRGHRQSQEKACQRDLDRRKHDKPISTTCLQLNLEDEISQAQTRVKNPTEYVIANKPDLSLNMFSRQMHFESVNDLNFALREHKANQGWDINASDTEVLQTLIGPTSNLCLSQSNTLYKDQRSPSRLEQKGSVESPGRSFHKDSGVFGSFDYLPESSAHSSSSKTLPSSQFADSNSLNGDEDNHFAESTLSIFCEPKDFPPRLFNNAYQVLKARPVYSDTHFQSDGTRKDQSNEAADQDIVRLISSPQVLTSNVYSGDSSLHASIGAGHYLDQMQVCRASMPTLAEEPPIAVQWRTLVAADDLFPSANEASCAVDEVADCPQAKPPDPKQQSCSRLEEFIKSIQLTEEHIQGIDHSVKYCDDVYEHRFVIFPRSHPFLKFDWDEQSRSHLLTESQWRALGIRQTRGWEHVGYSRNELHILLFRRPLGTDPRTGAMSPAIMRRAKQRQGAIEAWARDRLLAQEQNERQSRLDKSQLCLPILGSTPTIGSMNAPASAADLALIGAGSVLYSMNAQQAFNQKLSQHIRTIVLRPPKTLKLSHSSCAPYFDLTMLIAPDTLGQSASESETTFGENQPLKLGVLSQSTGGVQEDADTALRRRIQDLHAAAHLPLYGH